MQDIINGFFFNFVKEHLERAYDVDYHEVLDVGEREVDGEPSTAIDYRGVSGEYGTHVIRGLPLADFLKEIL